MWSELVLFCDLWYNSFPILHYTVLTLLELGFSSLCSLLREKDLAAYCAKRVQKDHPSDCKRLTNTDGESYCALAWFVDVFFFTWNVWGISLCWFWDGQRWSASVCVCVWGTKVNVSPAERKLRPLTQGPSYVWKCPRVWDFWERHSQSLTRVRLTSALRWARLHGKERILNCRIKMTVERGVCLVCACWLADR